jgi:hypothetical protein
MLCADLAVQHWYVDVEKTQETVSFVLSSAGLSMSGPRELFCSDKGPIDISPSAGQSPRCDLGDFYDFLSPCLFGSYG